MKTLVNIGFGSPVPIESQATQRAIGVGSRAEVNPSMTDAEVEAILRSVGPDALILLAGGAIAGAVTQEQLVTHATRVYRIAARLGLA